MRRPLAVLYIEYGCHTYSITRRVTGTATISKRICNVQQIIYLYLFAGHLAGKSFCMKNALVSIFIYMINFIIVFGSRNLVFKGNILLQKRIQKKIKARYTGWPRSYRKYILQITQPSQYGYAKLQYRCAVTSGSSSNTISTPLKLDLGNAFKIVQHIFCYL